MGDMNASVRRLEAKVELYNGSTLVKTFKSTDKIKSFTIERVGDESKFFGFGICQRLNIQLIDMARELDITTANHFKVFIGLVGDNYTNTSGKFIFPPFYVKEVNRDENTNELSITAYDALYEATTHKVEEITLTSYTIEEFARAAGALLGCSKIIKVPTSFTNTAFNTSYPKGANFEGTETIREALDDVAEATQTIYYLNASGDLLFRRLGELGTGTAYSIDKSKYFDLKSKTARRLSTICHATELGDNVSASITETGTTQYVRDNAFWDLREDIGTLVDNAIAAVGGFTLAQFEMEWRGDFTLPIGQKIALTTKDDEIIYSYILNDTISFDGGLTEKTSWNYVDNEEETADNPTSLGELLKQTYAKVDKANKNIELATSKIDEATKEMENLAKLTMTPEQVKILIQENQNTTGITTSTGFTFNSEGMTIAKEDSEMSTTVTEDGMVIKRNDEEVLTVNNLGVDAKNLRATTYLWIGTFSRFEDYNDSRTGCFWAGSGS